MDNSVIVYRSKSEQMNDEFWFSEGYFTATKQGDATCIGLVVMAICFIVYKIANKSR